MTKRALEAALWYASRMKWKVMPVWLPARGNRCMCGVPGCKSPGKHPMTPHGVNDATSDLAEIKKWPKLYKNFNVGIATGPESGLLVVDVDPRNGGSEVMEDLVEEYGDLPDVPRVRTGGGGLHFFFRYRGQREVSLGNGVDVQGDGKLVVAAPSLHTSGNQYEWLRKPQRGEKLPSPPDWIPRRGKNGNKANGNGHTPDVGPITEGARNKTLTSVLGGLRHYGAARETMLDTATSFNKHQFNPPLDDREVQTIVNSVARYAPAPAIASPDKRFGLDDLGNGERLAAYYGQDLAYTQSFDWLVWDGKRWERDNMERLLALAIETAKTITREADLTDDDKEKETIIKFARASRNGGKIREMIFMAKAQNGIPQRAEDFDTKNWVLNLLNGTLDLTSGDLHEHKRSDQLTKLAPVVYDPTAKAPLFMQFLKEIMLGDNELMTYLQRLFGYALTGSVREAILPIFYGFGSNGKSTLMRVMEHILGEDYAGPAPPGLLIAKYNQQSHPTEIADLAGKRLIVSSETGQGKQLAVEVMKQLTGGDKLKARFMRQDFFAFFSTFKIVMLTNNRPRVNDIDHAVWRRIQLVPFEANFDGPEMDLEIDEKLYLESSGILNWMLEGCIEWQRNGLQPPDKVLAATASYRRESDTLSDFLSECCYFAPKARISHNALFAAYRYWASQNKIAKPMGKNTFSARIAPRHDIRNLSTTKNGRSILLWCGIGINVQLITLLEKEDPDDQ